MLRAARLRSQGIAAGDVPRAVDTSAAAIEAGVARMLALQGQDLTQSLWAVGIRVPGATLAAVHDAFAERRIVRSWPMRGTLHIVRPDDLRMLLVLGADRTRARTARRRAELGLDAHTIGRAADVIRALLTPTMCTAHAGLDRRALFDGLRAADVDPDGGRGTHLLLHLAQDGLVAWGPIGDTGQRIVLLDAWAPAVATPDHDEALVTAFTGWLRGRAPARLSDFAHWSGLPLGQARRALAIARDGDPDAVIALPTAGALRDDPDPFLVLTGPAPALPGDAAEAAVHLLPGFDEYLLGYRDRHDVLEPAAGGRIVPGGNGVFLPMLVVRGAIVGTWRRSTVRGTTQVEVAPFSPPSATTDRGIRRAADRFGMFLGGEVTSMITTPGAGAPPTAPTPVPQPRPR